MRKLLSLVLAMTALGVSAQTFTSEGLNYKVTSATAKTVEVTTASPAYAIAEVTVPATVTYEGVTYSVTGIGDKAFMGNSTLTSITLPDGLKRIGTSAFQSCSKLETVNMGNTVETLGENAFFSCSKVTSLALSKTVKSVGKWGLRAMSSLTTLTLGESLEAVPAGMCWGNTKLKGITIPDKVTVIGENAFASCSALDSIQLGEKVDSLAGKAFAYVQSYKKLICRAPIPPKCGDEKSLGATAVYTKATLYVKEKSLDAYQKTEPWKNFTTILAYDPSGSLNDKTFVVAGVAYQRLGDDNFNVGITRVDTITYTGEFLARPTVNYAGQDFNVVAVQADAFKGCTGLTQVELPATIANIGNDAFSGCSDMKYLLSRATVPPTLGTGVFTGINFTNCKLFAARDGITAYTQAAQWKDFTNKGIIIDEATVDGLSYKCNNVIESTLDFTGAKGFKGALVIPDKVMIEGYPFYVTVIAGNSFYNTKITALTLPKTLKKIAGSAFFNLGEYGNPIERIVVPEGVTSIGNNAFYGSHVNYVELPKQSLTELASSAFYACDIKGIEILGSVGIVRGSTFYGSDMGWVVLGEGITEIEESAFFNTRIGSLKLPNSMRTIGKSAFSACSYLSSLTINEGLATVAEDAFANCASLYKIFNFATKMPQGLEAALSDSGDRIGNARTTYSVSDITKNGSVAWGTVAVRSDLNTMFDYKGVRYLPTAQGATTVMAVDASYGMNDTEVALAEKFTDNGKQYTVSRVNNYLLCGQTIMTKADVTYPLTSIPDGFVYNAINLKQINIPATVKSIGSYSFANTDSLAEVELPEGLNSIGVAGFYYSGITKLTVPSTVALMDNASFAGCRRLKELTFADGPTEVLIGYFPTMFGNRPMFVSSPIEKIEIGRNLNYLATAGYGYSPFWGDTLLTSVKFTNVPTVIGNNLFRDCKYLVNATVGNGVKNIGTAAFYGCAALDSVYLGNSVSKLNQDVFAQCANVKKFYCAAEVPPTCATGALTAINKQNCTLYVPQNGVTLYKDATQWKDFFNIEGYNFPGSVITTLDPTTSRFVVYNMNGMLILDTTDEELVNELPAGLYIINGKKIAKK